MNKYLISVIMLFGITTILTAEEELPPIAAKELTPREKTVKYKRQLKTGIMAEERIEAIRKLAATTDKDIVKEFAILAVIVEAAKNTKTFEREQYEALKGLVLMHTNGFEYPDLVVLLADMVENSLSVPIRASALNLIAQTAAAVKGGDINVEQRKAYMALKELWEKRPRLNPKMPPVLQARLLITLGSFWMIKDVKAKVLFPALREKDFKVRQASLEALQIYLIKSGDNDKEILDSVGRMLTAAQEKKDMLIRIQAMLVLDALAANDCDFKNASNLKKILVGMLETGSDDEATSSVRVLLRLGDPDLVGYILKAAKPAANKKWDFNTYHIMSMALVEVLNQMRPRATDKKVIASAELIADHFKWLIEKRRPTGEAYAPALLRKSAALGLGMWPRELDRVKPVFVLISSLDKEKEKEVFDEIRDSLKFITGQDKTRIDENGKEVVDIDGWKTWFNLKETKEGLAPNLNSKTKAKTKKAGPGARG